MNVRQKKQRSRDKIKHIMHPNLKKKEKPKQSRQFCYAEKFLWFGVDHNTKKWSQKPIHLQFAKEINNSNMKGWETYLIMDVCSRSLLNFQPHLHLHFILNNNKTYKDYMYIKC